jgi:reactive intermediate/imine deaminase
MAVMPRRLVPLFGLLVAAPIACRVENAPPPPPTPGAIQFLAPTESWPFPFSPAVKAGGFLFISGQIGTKMENGAPVLVSGGIEAETHQTMQNIRDILESNGSSLDRVVKCLVMIDDMAEWPRMNTVYATYFPGPKPARSALGADGLALNAKVEIECTAFTG